MELRNHGILARVLGHLDPLAGISPYRCEITPYSVVIADKNDEVDTYAILETLTGVRDDDDGTWEEQAQPDLSRLDPALAPACPGCGQLLALTQTADHCPRCACAVDLVELVVASHGPDVLARCYACGDPSDDLPAILLDQAPVSCPKCRYGLRGLDPVGACPACGEPYDKAALIHAFLDR